jgi:clostripain
LGILVVTTILASLNVGLIGNSEESNVSMVKETNSLGNIEQSNLAPEADAKDWTFMTYLDGDNNLEEAAISDLDEMEKGGGTNDDINVIVLIDRIAGYDTTNGDWKTGRYYEVSADASMAIDSVLLSDLGEVDMSHPDTLQNFIEYCFVNYPAEKYCLNLWDHGGGIFGACWDDTTGDGECLTLQEIQTAVKEATDNHGEYIDVISFDCCVMSMMEVAYEMRNYCDYFIASEETIPFDGYDYQPIISALIADVYQ